MKEYIESLEAEFKNYADSRIANEQKAYLRDQFEFYGIKTTERREIMRPFIDRNHLPDKKELNKIVKTLWNKPQREFHYFTQELVFKYSNQLEKQDIELLEFMVTNKSWWDTVDFIANKLIGDYFKLFPENRDKYINKWLKSNNLWLQRSALLFQLKYKKELDTTLLSSTIIALADSKEFFIRKAIGWVLREYSRTDPDWVESFVKRTKLSSLSEKEALRLIKN